MIQEFFFETDMIPIRYTDINLFVQSFFVTGCHWLLNCEVPGRQVSVLVSQI